MTAAWPISSNSELPSGVIAPRQSRSQATLERLLYAAEELLNTQTFEEITVADIVERAGSSVGSFYARFPTKDALLIALLELYHNQAVASLVEMSEASDRAELDLESRSRIYIQFIVDGCRRRRGVFQLRLRRRISKGESGLPFDKERGVNLVNCLKSMFDSVTHEIMHEDKDQALSFALRIVDSVALNTILLDASSSSFGKISDQELVEQLVPLMTGYLRGPV